MKKGDSESEKKSFMHVLRKLAHATIHHSCHESIVSVMILVVSDGPKRMKSVVNRPMDLNANKTMTSHAISTVMEMRLSSKMMSRNEFVMLCLGVWWFYVVCDDVQGKGSTPNECMRADT
jgi:hypothetical protein